MTKHHTTRASVGKRGEGNIMTSYNMNSVRSGYKETETTKAVFSAFKDAPIRKDGAFRTKEVVVGSVEYRFSSYYGNRYGWSGWTCVSHPELMEVLI